jgi:hypothetical protein
MESEWECVDQVPWDADGSNEVTRRMKVPGGWVYQTMFWPAPTCMGQTAPGIGMVFVPNPPSN